MPEIWPPTLPQCFSLGDTEQPGDPRIRSQPDMGPAKVRRRTSAMPALRSGVMRMTNAQWEILKAFGETNLQGWADAFLFPDADGDLVRFGQAIPNPNRVSTRHRMVPIELEVLP